MKRILFAATITDHFYYFHLPYIKYFHDLGWEVHVVGKGSRALPCCDVQHDIPIERSPFSTANIKAYKELKKIIADGKPHDVFNKVELLKGVGLDVPQPTELIFKLQKAGITFDRSVLHTDECVEAISKALED